MNLDFSALGNAINQFEKSLHYATSAAAKADPGLFEQLRNSVNHCFKGTAKEYCDLDLSIITDQPMSLSISAALAEDLLNPDCPLEPNP